ncbi:MAG TPA: universal stress protein [Chloroflexota bacterium]|nr:universal stress protein [Chloroflexota bacterium]
MSVQPSPQVEQAPPAQPARLRVLVAVDGTPAAAAALAVGRVLAAQLGARVAALHVTATPTDEREARQRLGLDAPETRDLELALRVGDPASEILRASSDDDGVTLLTMASRATDSAAPLASVTLSVIRHAYRPVVLVRPDLVIGHDVRPVRRLLVPVDGSPTTARALRSVTELAHRLGASINLLYVAGAERLSAEQGSITAPRYVDQVHHEWAQWSTEVVDRLMRCLARCPEDVPIELFLAVGDPGSEIVRFAAEHHEDAVVLVRRSELEPGRGKILWRIFEESPLSLVIVAAPYPFGEPAKQA